MRLQTILVTILTVLTFNACKKDKQTDPTPQAGSKGVYVVNEGAFGNSDATVSYYDKSSQTMISNMFSNANSLPLGDVAQSMIISGSSGFVVVNNSKKVEVVNINDFTSQSTITGFSGPRYMLIHNGAGYVTDWFSDDVKIVDLNTMSVTGSIPTGTGPEQMALVNDRIFVCNIGGWGSDSTITVINTALQAVEATINVGINPNSISTDLNNNIWILCGGSTGPDFIGGTADDIAGSLYKIDPSNYNITYQQTLQQFDHPLKLTYSSISNQLYFLMGSDGYTGKVVSLDPSIPGNGSTQINARTFYGLGVDPYDGLIYAGMAPGFSQNGYVFRFQNTGTLIDSMEVGIAPNGFAFKN